MGFESQPQFSHKQTEFHRASARPEDMSDETLTSYRKGVEWNIKNRPLERASYEEELRHVDEILATRKENTMH